MDITQATSRLRDRMVNKMIREDSIAEAEVILSTVSAAQRLAAVVCEWAYDELLPPHSGEELNDGNAYRCDMEDECITCFALNLAGEILPA